MTRPQYFQDQTDPPMVRRHKLTRCDVRKQAALIRKPAAHDRLRRFEMFKVNHQAFAVARGFFSRLLRELLFGLGKPVEVECHLRLRS